MDKNILFITMDCWSSYNSATTANTFASLFKNYDSTHMASLYLREEIPTSKQCCLFFSIAENSVLKSVFKPRTITGKLFRRDEMEITQNDISNIEKTKERYRRFGVKRNRILLFAREIMWMMGHWKSLELCEFLDDFKPDIVIFGMEGYCYFHRIVRYVLKYTGATGIGFFWDDNFTYIQHKRTIGFLLHRCMQRRSLRKTVKRTKKFLGISPKTKDEADIFFKINCTVVTKPVDIMWESTQEVYREKIKIVYTGNLKIGRLDTLKAISEILDEEKILSDKITFEIYSGTAIDDQIVSTFNKAINFMGAIPSEQVEMVQRNADVLLLLEDFQGENKLTARLSFSTKTTDYLGQGKCIFAIGNADIASIEYLLEKDCAICASNKQEIRTAMLKFVNEPELINIYGKKALQVGILNHSREIMEERMRKVIGD